VFWSETYADIKQTLQFKVADKQLEAVQVYEAVANVVSQAFGSEESGSSKKKTSDVKPENRVTTSHEAINLIKSIFG